MKTSPPGWKKKHQIDSFKVTRRSVRRCSFTGQHCAELTQDAEVDFRRCGGSVRCDDGDNVIPAVTRLHARQGQAAAARVHRHAALVLLVRVQGCGLRQGGHEDLFRAVVEIPRYESEGWVGDQRPQGHVPTRHRVHRTGRQEFLPRAASCGNKREREQVSGGPEKATRCRPASSGEPLRKVSHFAGELRVNIQMVQIPETFLPTAASRRSSELEVSVSIRTVRVFQRRRNCASCFYRDTPSQGGHARTHARTRHRADDGMSRFSRSRAFLRRARLSERHDHHRDDTNDQHKRASGHFQGVKTIKTFPSNCAAPRR